MTKAAEDLKNEVANKLTRAVGKHGKLLNSALYDSGNEIGFSIQLPKLTDSQLSAVLACIDGIARKSSDTERTIDADGRTREFCHAYTNSFKKLDGFDLSANVWTLGFTGFKNYRDALSAKREADKQRPEEADRTAAQARYAAAEMEWKDKQYQSSPEDQMLYLRLGVTTNEGRIDPALSVQTEKFLEEVVSSLPAILDRVTEYQVPTFTQLVGISYKFGDSKAVSVNHQTGYLEVDLGNIATKAEAQSFVKAFSAAICKEAGLPASLANRHIKASITGANDKGLLQPEAVRVKLECSFLAAEVFAEIETNRLGTIIRQSLEGKATHIASAVARG